MIDIAECYKCMDIGLIPIDHKAGEVSSWNGKTGKADGKLIDLVYVYYYSCTCENSKKYRNVAKSIFEIPFAKEILENRENENRLKFNSEKVEFRDRKTFVQAKLATGT